MAGRFSRDHFDVSESADARDYTSHRPNIVGEDLTAQRRQRGAALRAQYASAISNFDQRRPEVDHVPQADGTFLQVKVTKPQDESALQGKREGRRTGATQLDPDGSTRVGVFVPTRSQQALDDRFEAFGTGELTRSGNPQFASLVGPIRAIQAATFETYWTDSPHRLPEDRSQRIWWEVWTHPDDVDAVAALAEQLGLAVREREAWLTFPGATIVPILTDQNTIEAILFSGLSITELRRGGDTPFVFTSMDGGEQQDWSEEMAERIAWPGSSVPAVTLLDTGVNRAHVLVEPALSREDMFSVRSEWGTSDRVGHGTSMAGIALHGDLMDMIGDASERTLRHRLESVKLMPPASADPVDERSYGPVTQSGIVLPEIQNAARPRVFCLAITNENISGQRPTSWSAALDQAAFGSMPGDDD